MTENDTLKGAEAFSAEGDQRGALILHGFTGTPQSMRGLAEAFVASGFSVEQPLLPGHGTSPEDMAETDWDDWSAAVKTAYEDLASRTSSVVVCGLSMGGTLALWLACYHPEIAGIVLINPAVEAEDFSEFEAGANAVLSSGEVFLPSVGGDIADPDASELAYDKSPARGILSLVGAMRDLKPKLSNIAVPALLFHSLQDHVIPPGSAELVRNEYGGPIEYLPLERSFHVATLDFDGPEINRQALAFSK